MKLTTEQIRQIIKEELHEVTKGKYSKNRTIYAPGPVDQPGSRYPQVPYEKGSSIVYDEPEFHPKLKKYQDLDPELAKELQRALLSDNPEDLKDFNYVLDRIEAGPPSERALADLNKHVSDLRRAYRKARREGREEDLKQLETEIATVEAAIEKLDRRSKDPYGDTERDRPKGARFDPRRPVRKNR